MAENSDKEITYCKKIGSKYVNPYVEWPHGYYNGALKLIKWMWSMFKTQIKDMRNVSNDLPIIIPDFKYQSRRNNSNIIVTWFGHSSILLEIEGFTILCDPVFSETCGPYVGLKRYRDAPCKIKDLPEIDAVVISHNHYDHMDEETIRELSNTRKNLKWYIPIGDKNNLSRMISKNDEIYEMIWWEELDIEKPDKTLKIVFTPTQHWSNRGLFDTFKSLWGSYAFIGKNSKFWFGGDTGYCKAFKEIHGKYGSFTGAAIPIGAYKPRDLLKFQHCDPSEAVQIHKDLDSNVSFGIHWGTFKLSEEGYMEPKKDLENCVREENEKIREKNDKIREENEKVKDIIRFITIKHGQTLLIEDKNYEILDPTQN